MNSIIVKAYAKINLGLDVLRRREDGYHDVRMIMQTLNLYDTMTIKKTNAKQIFLKTNLPYLPNDKRNLVYRATLLFQNTFQLNEGLRINLKKRIPVAAGLAGGSSDAAAALRGLNTLYNTKLTLSELMKLGVQLGADVPYCIMMGTALSEGIGEILTPLTPMPNCDILLVKPSLSISTKHVYENLKLTDAIKHPDISTMRKAIERHNLIDLSKHMDNILESVTINDYPIISDIKEKMREYGAIVSLMSGSGPTVFGIFTDHALAEKAFQSFRYSKYGKQIFLTKPYWLKHNL